LIPPGGRHKPATDFLDSAVYDADTSSIDLAARRRLAIFSRRRRGPRSF